MAEYYKVQVNVVSPQPVYLANNKHHTPMIAEDKVFVPSRRFQCPMMAIPQTRTILDIKITFVQK